MSRHQYQKFKCSNEITFLQETWLTNFDTQCLTIISDTFYAKGGISSMDYSIHLLAGSPHGGLGILWRKYIYENCNIVDLDDERLIYIIQIISCSICLELMIFFKHILLHMCKLLVTEVL